MKYMQSEKQGDPETPLFLGFLLIVNTPTYHTNLLPNIQTIILSNIQTFLSPKPNLYKHL